MTLTPPFAIAGANATEFAAGAVDTTLAPGESATLLVTFIPVGDVGSRSATLTVTASGFAPVAVTLIGSGQAAPVGLNTSVVISEFRVRGPSGGNDEFVEVYNNADAPVNIGGWKLKASNSAGATSTRATVPGGIVIPPRGHFLFVNSSASGYSGAVAGNQTYGTGITDDGGIAITRPDDTIVDQVGMSAGSAFKEGTPLPNLGTTSAANLNRGYERQLGGAEGSRIDTDNNAADFAVRMPSEPQNLASDPTPGITVAPATIEFGSLAIGRTAHAVVTVVNVTSAAADIGPVVAATGDISQFVVGAPGTTTLNAGASTAVDIAFAPSVTGAAAALVSVASGRGTRTISLSGTATPGITVTPASLDFGTIAFHDSASTIVMITNGDSAAVTLTPPFVVSGEEAAEFSVGAPATTSLASGASTSVAVTLTPVSLGAKSATLTITSANGGDRTVVLSASVVCPSILVGPASLPAGTVDVPYSQALTATGAPGPFMFDAIGMLPPGVTLDADGRLAGIPTATGTFAFTVHAMEATSCGASTSYALTIRRGTPTLTFPVPADMEYGTALGPAQLNAMSSVPGSFAYAPDAGTVLPLGPRQTLIAVFTPADAANYNGGTVTTTINVVDTTPPAIVAIAPGAATLWPPNKAMVPVALAVAATDAADRSPVCRVTSISSNEGTSADAQIVGALAVNLRADRNGDGGGRIYTIGVRCIDASGNASTSAATVTVPHDRR
jgi:hypothetical protein